MLWLFLAAGCLASLVGGYVVQVLDALDALPYLALPYLVMRGSGAGRAGRAPGAEGQHGNCYTALRSAMGNLYKGTTVSVC